MARINLLPWREEYRKEKKEEFIKVLIGAAAVAGLCAYLWVSLMQLSIDSQLDRNNILNQEIGLLQVKVEEIRTLKKKREELLDRMDVIQNLQGKRPIIVRHFDELVKVVPEGVYIDSLSRKASKISIEGVTESNVRVSSLMRNVSGSEWFSSPNLRSVKAAPQLGEQASSFHIDLTAADPSNKKEGAD